MEPKTDIRAVIAVAVFLTLACGMIVGLNTRPVEQAKKKDTLVIATLDDENIFTSTTPYGEGLTAEILNRFEAQTGYSLLQVVVHNRGDAFEELEQGRIDILVLAGDDRPLSMDSPFVSGPAYAHYQPKLVEGKRLPFPVLDPEGIVEAEEAAEEQIIFDNDFGREDIEVINSLYDYNVRESDSGIGRFKLPAPMFLETKSEGDTPTEIPVRWFWRSNDSAVAQLLSNFWDTVENDDSLTQLTELYYGFMPAEVDYYQLSHFSKVLGRRLPTYRDYILEQAQKYDLDPLLLTAVIYQESLFNPRARSRTGVRGLMQLTMSTARWLGVENRLDPFESIRGGCKYLSMIKERLEPLNLEPWDEIFFTLAAYNQGPGHLSDAVELAKSMGGTGKTWREVKAVFPLLSWSKYYSESKYGRCNGREAVDYVDSIRYYYYVLNGFISLPGPEREHLDPFIAAGAALNITS